ncbi:hypothetical protein [Spiroplasma endosymbiont of Diplazon laetatorius]|uniref:hypothetical protein n=1 Tax=Spiroplasma endosymbiont of Diplazon laetatorius TaxID=3066322 RepID=UPI0030D09EA6
MVKLFVYLAFFLIVGFTVITNIGSAAAISLEYIKYWFGSENDFYKLVSQLFIITTHPIWLLFLSFGTLIMVLRLFFG